MKRADDSAPDDFKMIGVTEERCDAADRDQARSGYRLFAGRDGFEVAVAEHVIERALRWGRAAAPNEWYGLIVGRVGDDSRGRHVVVLGIVPDSDARATPGFVETSHASEFATRELSRRLYPDGVIVGWTHGHHRVGARYSTQDRRNQATWTQPHSLGIVFDPWDPKELAVYRGPTSEELRRVMVREDESEAASPGAEAFRAITSSRDLTRLGSAPASSPTRSAPRRFTKVVLVGLAIVFAVVVVRRERRAFEDLGRRVRSLEARPRPECCPTPAVVRSISTEAVPMSTPTVHEPAPRRSPAEVSTHPRLSPTGASPRPRRTAGSRSRARRSDP